MLDNTVIDDKDIVEQPAKLHKAGNMSNERKMRRVMATPPRWGSTGPPERGTMPSARELVKGRCGDTLTPVCPVRRRNLSDNRGLLPSPTRVPASLPASPFQLLGVS